MKTDTIKKFLPILILGSGLALTIIIIIIITIVNLSAKSPSSSTATKLSSPTLIPAKSNYNANSLNPNDITIGTTTQQDLQNKLGTPTTITQQNNYVKYNYQVQGTTRNDQIYLQDNKVKYIAKEITYDNTSYSDFVNQKNITEDGVLYDKMQDGAGFQWYIFSKEGVAFLANKQYGYVIQTKYFPPTDYQTFLNTSAKDLNMLTTKPSEEERWGNQ